MQLMKIKSLWTYKTLVDLQAKELIQINQITIRIILRIGKIITNVTRKDNTGIIKMAIILIV